MCFKLRAGYFCQGLLFLFVLFACKTNSSDRLDTGISSSQALFFDSVWVETSTVQKTNFTTEIWCNGSLQAGQKIIINAEYCL